MQNSLSSRILQENLSSITHLIAGPEQMLQYFQRNANNLPVSRIESILDGDDQLRYARKDLVSTVCKHIVNCLSCEHLIGMSSLDEALEKHGEVEVEIKFGDVSFP